MSAPHLRTVAIPEDVHGAIGGSGTTTGVRRLRLVTLDDRILIDDYHPADDPHVRWYCDNCNAGHPVTAQFKYGEEPDGQYVTLCRACLQRAIDGIDYSLANPKPSDGEPV